MNFEWWKYKGVKFGWDRGCSTLDIQERKCNTEGEILVNGRKAREARFGNESLRCFQAMGENRIKYCEDSRIDGIEIDPDLFELEPGN